MKNSDQFILSVISLALALKKLIASGELGRLKIIHSAFTVFLPPGGNVPCWHFDHKLADSDLDYQLLLFDL